MFKIKKSNEEFIFLESNEKIIVFKNKNGEVSQIADFFLAGLVASLESLKKDHIEILKSKNIWILDSSIENIEKAPLAKEEMINFIKWKLQEVIDVPLHDVYFDILTNNNLDNNFYKKFATVAVAKKKQIDTIITSFSTTKIPLHAVDGKATVLLDFFTRNKSLIEKKSLTLLTLTDDKANMCVYYDGGLAFERIIELPKLRPYINDWKQIPEEELQSVLDKICLEIQRNVDFLDRQFGIQHFENIIYDLPENEIFNKLKNEISSYFSVQSLDVSSMFENKSKKDEKIPMLILAAFEYGKIRDEVINLLPKVEKKTGFIEDLKKAIMASVLLGLVAAISGGFYEWKAKENKEIVTTLKSDNENLSKEIIELKGKNVQTNENLEKEIANLDRNKNEIIQTQSQKKEGEEDVYQKMLREISIQVKTSGVSLDEIKFLDKNIYLSGFTNNKELFSIFLKNLQKTESLKGVSLSLLSLEQRDNGFNFIISSDIVKGQ